MLEVRGVPARRVHKSSLLVQTVMRLDIPYRQATLTATPSGSLL